MDIEQKGHELGPHVAEDLQGAYTLAARELFPENPTGKGLVIYHPSGAYDVSPSAAFPDARVLYAELNKDAVKQLSSKGYEIMRASATGTPAEVGEEEVAPYTLPDDVASVDMVILLNPGIAPDGPVALLKQNGYVLCNDYHGTASALRDSGQYEFVGVVDTHPSDRGPARMQTSEEGEDYWKQAETDADLSPMDRMRRENFLAYWANTHPEFVRTGSILHDYQAAVAEAKSDPRTLESGGIYLHTAADGRTIPLQTSLPRKGGHVDNFFVFRKKA